MQIYKTIMIKTILKAVLILIIVSYFSKKDNPPTCPASFQEKVFKFHEIYGNEVGHSVRANKMKQYMIDGNMGSFYETYGEIYQEFEYFDHKMNHHPFYHDGLILLQEMV